MRPRARPGRPCASSSAAPRASLGAITQVALRVHAVPEAQRFEGWLAADFESGFDALRQLVQNGIAPDVARLSDADETRFSLAFAGLPSVARRAVGRRCLMICGWQGDADAIGARRKAAARVLRGAGAVYATQRAGREWVASRFAGPYLRDALMDRGVLVETLETATSWTNLAALHGAVRAALGDVLVGCHVSHLYATGASLYFTVFARAADDPAAQWRSLKAAATDAIVGAGGTLTHHHAVGRDHARWLRGRGRPARRRGPARGEGALRPGRDHEPGEAAPRERRRGLTPRPRRRSRRRGDGV